VLSVCIHNPGKELLERANHKSIKQTIRNAFSNLSTTAKQRFTTHLCSIFEAIFLPILLNFLAALHFLPPVTAMISFTNKVHQIKLSNKAIKIINPTNMGSLEDHFQHLNILCLPKLYSFSVGKFMHSYRNKLLPNHFDEYFIPLSSIHYHSTRLTTSKNLFLPRVNSSSGKCSLKFIGPKVWSSIPDDIKLSTTFTFKWKLKKHLLHEKNSQLWTLATFLLSNKLLWILVFCNSVLFFVCIYFFLFSVCTFYASRHEVHFLFFLFCFVFFCTSLISFCDFFTFYITIF